MILEFRSDARMRRSRGDSFPFIHGSLLESGWPSRWCVLPVPSDRSGKGTPLLDPLSDECRQALAEELHAWRPDVLLCDETPPPSLSSFLRETAPRIRVHTVMSLGPDRGLSLRLDELLSLLSGAQAPRATQRDEAPAIVDSASPNYEQHSLLPLSAQYSNRPRYLVGGRICAYRRSLASNSSFSAIDDPIVASHRGCSFCDVHRHDVHWRMIRSPLLDLALRQIERHQSTTLDRGSRLAYIIEDSAVSLKPRIFFDRILRLGLRPSSFHLYLRANEFLAMRHEFEAVLPYLRDAGHEIRIMCMGAENFSPIENERFNKGIQPALVWEAMDALKALEIEYPDSFFFSEEGGLSAILFTPWTRLEDLRLNLLAGRRIGVEWTRYALGTRLQIRPESAMAALLDHEGLRAVGFDGDAHVDPVCLGPDEGQIAWRFACPKTALAHW
ncbi:MAG: radical SAM protein, partial [Myxococcales bacterium]|nr:radical SAM protein [Myxococcales bacterium]